MTRAEKDLLFRDAVRVLKHNCMPHFTRLTEHLYPHQWSWDAAFFAIGLAHIDLDRAMQERRHIFRGKWTNGMLPHILFDIQITGQYFPEPDFWQCDRMKAVGWGNAIRSR